MAKEAEVGRLGPELVRIPAAGKHWACIQTKRQRHGLSKKISGVFVKEFRYR